MSVIEKGSWVLVTGVTGFIGGHVALELLEAKFKVRGTTRSISKAQWLVDLFEKYGKDNFELVEVPDMSKEGAYDDAVKGVNGIVHLASDLTFGNKPEEVITPTVKGTLNVLKSASMEPGIKSFVYTSSSTAALMPVPNEKIKVTKDTWNDESVHDAWNNPSPSPYVIYGASKTEAERAIWKVVAETKPPFQVSAVLPNANFGKILKPGAEESSSTASWITKFYKGDKSMADIAPPQWFVNVQDTARLHVIALEDPSCNGQRIFAFAETYTWNSILEIFRKQNPGQKFLEDLPDMGQDLSEVPNAEAEALLKKHYGRGFLGLEESIAQNTATLK